MKATPSTDRGRATVDRALDAACVLFARQGIKATTLDQIGDASGVGRGQLYHFFRGKQDLVADAVALQVDRVLDAQQPLLRTLHTPEQLREWCRLAVTLHRDAEDPVRCPIGTLVHELGEDEPLARNALAAGFRRWRGELADGLHRIADSGGLRPGTEPATMATGLLAAYQGGLLLAHAEDDLDLLAAALDAVAVNGLRG